MKRFLFALLVWFAAVAVHAAEPRPNIVWIFGEDMGPELGSYGDPNALTPNMDRLAREGARFQNCFTHAPVCAPSRSGLITGRYPTSIGSHHMRSTLLAPPPMFTEHLRKAGYLVCWPTKSPHGKTDFNFPLPKDCFDRVDDWTKDIPKQPFFGFFNITTSHESQIRAAPDEVRNLAGLPLHEAKLKELRAALDQWITDTKDLGAIPETELIRRGIVADRLAEYEKRKEPKK